MKTLIVRFVIVAVMLFACISYAGDVPASYQNNQANYYLVILPTLKGLISAAISINNVGSISGYSDLTDGTRHAILWQNETLQDLETLGSPGTHSSVAWPVKNNKGLIVGISETDEIDPYLENWSCSGFFPGDPTHHQCLGFSWENGFMTPLPTLGGNNGYAAGANNRNQIVGWAENETLDPTCELPQRLQFRAVVWGPNEGQFKELPPYPGDPTSAATAINDKGKVVGISGICNRAVGRLSAIRAVVWEDDTVIPLDDLGVGAWNTPTSINQKDEISGFVNQPGATVTGLRPRAVLWTRNSTSDSEEYDMHQLPMLSGDTRSFAWSVNNHGQVAGQSYGGPSGSRAVIWNNGIVTDLNTLTPPGSLLLVFANDINDRGEITGQAYDPDTGELLPFLAIPPVGGFESALSAAQGRVAPKGTVPEKMLKRALHRFGINEVDLE